MKIKGGLATMMKSSGLIKALFCFFILFKIGGVDILIPGSSLSGVYLYDFVNDRDAVGTDTPIARYKDFNATVGIAVEVDEEFDKGIPFFGVDYNIREQKLIVGGYLGRDPKTGEAIAGVKSSYKFW